MYLAVFDSYATNVMFQPGNGDRSNMPNYLVIPVSYTHLTLPTIYSV